MLINTEIVSEVYSTVFHEIFLKLDKYKVTFIKKKKKKTLNVSMGNILCFRYCFPFLFCRANKITFAFIVSFLLFTRFLNILNTYLRILYRPMSFGVL